jgi:hypothetical protein
MPIGVTLRYSNSSSVKEARVRTLCFFVTIDESWR